MLKTLLWVMAEQLRAIASTLRGCLFKVFSNKPTTFAMAPREKPNRCQQHYSISSSDESTAALAGLKPFGEIVVGVAMPSGEPDFDRPRCDVPEELLRLGARIDEQRHRNV